MNEDLKKIIDKAQISRFCQLKSINADCPWKKYEGLTPKEFIEQNFSCLKKYTTIFEDLISTVCLDIVFIEEYSEKLQKKYWFCVYYFGNNAEGNPKYFIGGEPEKNIILPHSLKEKCNISDFPTELKTFWNIHGLFDIEVNHGKMDFNIGFLKENLSPEDGEGKVPHYTTLTLSGNDIGITEWVALDSGYVSIDDLENIDFDDDENFNTSLFVEEYLKKGVYFMQSNADVILLLQSYQGLPHFFYLCHNCGSNFYSTFWEYLATDFSWLNKEYD